MRRSQGASRVFHFYLLPQIAGSKINVPVCTANAQRYIMAAVIMRNVTQQRDASYYSHVLFIGRRLSRRAAIINKAKSPESDFRAPRKLL